ncbi:MAG: glycosyltransferase family 4 protein [Actinomycetota bacterium]|nr:glycosyltransferase family 4 protein [Actinomycetota bacterium]
MRILLWHGYLLGGTGSNVYTRSLAREWSRAGHDVVVVCQEPHPERYDLGGAKVFRPNIGGLLPVFVLDRYEGLEVKLLQDFTRAELQRYVALNATALCAHMPADLVFANHVLLGAAVGWASGMPFAVKTHGSELEYSMRGSEELATWGRECLASAEAVFVGSAHIRNVLEEVVGHVDRVHEVPPGVDIDEFRPSVSRDESLARLLEEAGVDAANPANSNERQPDEGNAARLEEFFATDEPTVVYFGKLLHNKGVHILLEALRSVDVRAVIVGFGDYREELELIAPPGTLFTGPLEHRHLVHLLQLADVTVVPSIFPEAFGMVAAEAAAAGSPPLVARHSGLAEIAEGLEAEYPAEHRHLASFANGDTADLAAKLVELLALPPETRAELGAAARRAAVERWSWTSVATRLLEPIAGG